MSTINLKLYDLARLKLQLSESDSKEFAQTIDEVINDDIKASTNEFKSLFKEDFNVIDKRYTEIDKRFVDVDKRLLELDKRITESKVDIIKWLFGFFVAIFLMLISIYLKK